jgi:DNA invertase Pin-like site-specific DNA recombinase
LVSLDEHIDLTLAFGRMAVRLRFNFAGFERELIGEPTSTALAHKRAAGRVASRVEYEYDRDGDLLVPNAAEQRVIRLMRKRRAAGESDNAIARYLNERGTPTKRGGCWQANTVYCILRRVEAAEDARGIAAACGLPGLKTSQRVSSRQRSGRRDDPLWGNAQLTP